MTPIVTRKPARRWSGGISVDWATGPSAGKTLTHSSLKISKTLGTRRDQFAQTT
jgi:hypothetical protein